MASQLTLDRSDAGVDDLVSQWKDGGRYKVMLEIAQTKSSPNVATFEVTSVTDESEEPSDETGAAEQAATPAPAAKPAKSPVSVAY